MGSQGWVGKGLRSFKTSSGEAQGPTDPIKTQKCTPVRGAKGGDGIGEEGIGNGGRAWAHGDECRRQPTKTTPGLVSPRVVTSPGPSGPTPTDTGV